MNSKTLSACAGAAFASIIAMTSAVAADLRGETNDTLSLKDTPAPRITWTGFYIGGNVGAAWTDAKIDAWYQEKSLDTMVLSLRNDNDTPSPPTAPAPLYTAHESISDVSLIGGLHSGYNFQRGVIVYGVEGDIGFSDHIDYLASLRGRLGLAADNWLFYGTAGVAFISGGYKGNGHIKSEAASIAVGTAGTAASASPASSSPGAPYSYDTTDSQVGFVAGGGVEVKLSQNWSAGVEGLHYFFDGGQDSHGSASCGVSAESLSDITVVRGRLSYHLNGGYEPLK